MLVYLSSKKAPLEVKRPAFSSLQIIQDPLQQRNCVEVPKLQQRNRVEVIYSHAIASKCTKVPVRGQPAKDMRGHDTECGSHSSRQLPLRIHQVRL